MTMEDVCAKKTNNKDLKNRVELETPKELKFQPQTQEIFSRGLNGRKRRVRATMTEVCKMTKNDNILEENDQPQPLDELNSQPQSQAASNGVNSVTKRGRGPARFPKEWGTEKKLVVYLDKHGCVIGPDYNKYITAVGCLARIGSKLPLNYPTFTDIPQYQRDIVWDDIEHSTTLPLEAKNIVMKAVDGIWRNWKSYIKKQYFEPHKDDEEYLLQLPTERIQKDQWLQLVSYWKLEEVQSIASQNSKNVSTKGYPHRTGRTPFSSLEQEFLSHGIDPTELDIWLESRSRGNGIENDPDTSELHAQFIKELSKKPESEITKEFKQEIFKNALGKERHGRVRCAGRGVTTNHVYDASISASEQRQFLEEREELQKFKDTLTNEREQMQKVKEEMIREKEELV